MKNQGGIITLSIITMVISVGLFASVQAISNSSLDRRVSSEHQIAYNEGYRQGYDRGYQEAWKAGYDRGFADGQAPYKSSSNTTISLDKVLAILELGKANHLWWAGHPELQTKETGDIAFNLMWAGYYDQLIDFVRSVKEGKYRLDL